MTKFYKNKLELETLYDISRPTLNKQLKEDKLPEIKEVPKGMKYYIEDAEEFTSYYEDKPRIYEDEIKQARFNSLFKGILDEIK